MKKLFISAAMATLLGLTFAGCSSQSPATNEQDKAAQVVQKFLDVQGKVTYQTPSSYTAGDRWMTAAAAKKFNDSRSGMYRFFTANQITISGGPTTVSFLNKKGNDYIFEGKKNLSLYSAKENKNIGNLSFDNDFTVSKQKDGSFLISNITNHMAH